MRRWTWFRPAQRSGPLFALGHVVITDAARDALRRANVPAGALLRRHAVGDWGNVDQVDHKQNELGLRLGLRLRSVYSVRPTTPMAPCGTDFDVQIIHQQVTVWVISQPNRAKTTVSLPSEIFDETNAHGIDDAKG
ncbi:MAG: hypothetical protein EON54_07935 [Alcaligenaceae bacterium]|nr:MAG: hypothetical protein EON54_07935 [Alcaligenaceae bacterium]